MCISIGSRGTTRHWLRLEADMQQSGGNHGHLSLASEKNQVMLTFSQLLSWQKLMISSDIFHSPSTLLLDPRMNSTASELRYLKAGFRVYTTYPKCSYLLYSHLHLLKVFRVHHNSQKISQLGESQSLIYHESPLHTPTAVPDKKPSFQVFPPLC